MIEKTCCFSGHRNLPKKDKKRIAAKLKEEIISLINKKYVYFGSGGALGFDTIAAQTVLRLRKTYPQIKLILVLPCPTQADAWSRKDKKAYEDIKRKADKVTYTSELYYDGCMHKRNRHLVDNSSICVCYQTENKGGTFYTVNYARKNGKAVINIADLI